MEKVDQDYLDAIISSQTNTGGTDDSKSSDKDPMEIYESIKEEAVNLGKGNLSLDNDIIMKFFQVSFRFCCIPKIYSKLGSDYVSNLVVSLGAQIVGFFVNSDCARKNAKYRYTSSFSSLNKNRNLTSHSG